MDPHRIRNAIPPLYAALIFAGFLISATVGIIVLIVAGSLSGLLWSALGAQPRQRRDGRRRTSRRAHRRSGRPASTSSLTEGTSPWVSCASRLSRRRTAYR